MPMGVPWKELTLKNSVLQTFGAYGRACVVEYTFRPEELKSGIKPQMHYIFFQTKS